MPNLFQPFKQINYSRMKQLLGMAIAVALGVVLATYINKAMTKTTAA